MRKRSTLAALGFALSLDAIAQTTYYQCTDEQGRAVFSERPCGDDAQEKAVQAAIQTGSVAPEDFGAISASRKIRERERQIDYLDDRIERYERERDLALRELERKMTYANNNLAGAQYRESLATQMQSVSEEYRSKIRSDREKAARYREEIHRLQGAGEE